MTGSAGAAGMRADRVTLSRRTGRLTWFARCVLLREETRGACVCVCVRAHLPRPSLRQQISFPLHGEKRPSLLTLRKINVSGWGRLFSGTTSGGHVGVSITLGRCADVLASLSVCIIYSSDGTEGTGGGSQSEKSPTHYGKTSRAGHLESGEGIFFEKCHRRRANCEDVEHHLQPSAPPSAGLAPSKPPALGFEV